MAGVDIQDSLYYLSSHNDFQLDICVPSFLVGCVVIFFLSAPEDIQGLRPKRRCKHLNVLCKRSARSNSV